MAAKKTQSKDNTKTDIAINVPSYVDYFIPEDEVTGQRSSFTPYKITLTKMGGNGTITLEHKTDPMVAYESYIEVIFLHFPKFTQSQKLKDVDGQSKQVEFSYDMQWCTAGYPYKESPHSKDKDGSKTRLKREAYLLVRDPREGETFHLAKFNSVLKNVKALQEIYSRVHADATRKYKLRSGAQTIVKIGIQKVTENGYTVTRYKPEYEIVDVINQASFDDVRKLASEITKTVEDIAAGAKERAKARWEATLEERDKEAARNISSYANPVSNPDVPPVQAEEAKPEPTTDADTATEDDDDDLPF